MYKVIIEFFPVSLHMVVGCSDILSMQKEVHLFT